MVKSRLRRMDSGVHCVNGSPENPSLQKHIGVWLTALHCALIPQELGQGSLHFWLIHAWLVGHSLLLMHSGRQFGGEFTKFGKQEHEGESLMTWHCAFGPQGDGWHGLIFTGSWAVKKVNSLIRC